MMGKEKRYTHEGKLVGFHEFSCRDTGKTRTVKLRRTPKFWCDESGRMYDADGWPRFRRDLWRLDIESVRRTDQTDILYSGQAPCQSCGDTMPCSDLIKGRCLCCLEKAVQEELDDIYQIFAETIADGRNVSVDSVNNLRRLQKRKVDGWTVNYKQLDEISNKVKDLKENVLIEKIEAVILAMVDLGYLELGDDHETE